MIKSLRKRLRRIGNSLYIAFQYLTFYWTYRRFLRTCPGAPRFKAGWGRSRAYLRDATITTGFSRHYVYHPAWAVRVLQQTAPAEHVDISSTLHFCSILSAFLPVRFYDFRPAALELSNLTSERTDLTHLHFASNSLPSLSCMHTVEHIGLGRYGDPLDYDGDLKAMRELSRVLAVGGNLLFVVPVAARALVRFNADRTYTKKLVVETFAGFGLTLKEFTLIPDYGEDGGLVPDPSDELLSRQHCGCGCFWFTKEAATPENEPRSSAGDDRTPTVVIPKPVENF